MVLKKGEVQQFKIKSRSTGVGYENVIGIWVGGKLFVYRARKDTSEWIYLGNVVETSKIRVPKYLKELLKKSKSDSACVGLHVDDKLWEDRECYKYGSIDMATFISKLSEDLLYTVKNKCKGVHIMLEDSNIMYGRGANKGDIYRCVIRLEDKNMRTLFRVVNRSWIKSSTLIVDKDNLRLIVDIDLGILVGSKVLNLKLVEDIINKVVK